MNESTDFFDTHCHLHEAVFDEDRNKIIDKMRRQGIRKFLTIGTSPDDTERALRVRDKYSDMCLVATAIDPTSTQQYVNNVAQVEKDFKKIEKIARENNISAIGETGLDKYWRLDDAYAEKFTPETLEIQHMLFELHIDLAKELKLPLVIHQREALSPTLKTLQSHGFIGRHTDRLGVFHSFTGDINEATRITEIGFYIGINGIVTFKNASKLQGTVKNIDPAYILYETDAPFLTPEPYRGQRNDPTLLPLIAETIEGLQQKPISSSIYTSSQDLFL